MMVTVVGMEMIMGGWRMVDLKTRVNATLSGPNDGSASEE